TRAGLDRAAMAAWSRDTQWMGLEIVEAIGGGERGGAREDEGVVEFVARGVTKGVPFAQRERSRFRKLEGRWYYVDGVAAQAKAAVTAGRNDACPCGSGVKYKRCHGA
ncbi:MAG TPA: YchJ family metal-binding protein, partial [Kofleriaceae bacterium]